MAWVNPDVEKALEVPRLLNGVSAKLEMLTDTGRLHRGTRGWPPSRACFCQRERARAGPVHIGGPLTNGGTRCSSHLLTPATRPLPPQVSQDDATVA